MHATDFQPPDGRLVVPGFEPYFADVSSYCQTGPWLSRVRQRCGNHTGRKPGLNEAGIQIEDDESTLFLMANFEHREEDCEDATRELRYQGRCSHLSAPAP